MVEYTYFSSKFNPLYVYRHCGYQKKSVEAEPRHRLKYTKHSNICSNIWDTTNSKVKQHWGWVEKSCCLQKKRVYDLALVSG